MMRKILLVLLVILMSFAVLSPPQMAWAKVRQEGNVWIVEYAEGFAAIRDGNKNAAREEARRSAYRDALEKALGAVVTGVTEMKNYEVVLDKVFSQTQGIVRKFDIVREKEDDGILYIEAICHVSESALDGVLGPAVLDALGNPRLMVLIDERVAEKTPFISTSESEIMRIFEKAGYLLVDPGQATILKEIDLDAIRKRNDPETFRQVARDFQADVLVYGRAYGNAFTSQVMSGQRIYGVKSTVQLRAVLANTAYQLGSETFEENSKGISVEDGAIKGIRIASEKAGNSIVNKIAYALVSGSAGGIPGRTIKIKISNISFGAARDLRENLQGLHGVSGVYQRLYRDRILELDIVSDKTADDIASVLYDFGFEIEDLSSSLVEGSVK